MLGTLDTLMRLGFGPVYALFDSVIRSTKSGSIQIVNPSQYWIDAIRGIGTVLQNPLGAAGNLVAADKWATDPGYAAGVTVFNVATVAVPVAGAVSKAANAARAGTATRVGSEAAAAGSPALVERPLAATGPRPA